MLRGLALLACLGCCALPPLLAAGVLGGAGWVFLSRSMPVLAFVLLALAVLAVWATGARRRSCGCRDTSCAC